MPVPADAIYRQAQHCSAPQPNAKMALDVQATHVEGLNATEFLISSSEHASGCRGVAKLLFDTGACCAEYRPAPPHQRRPHRLETPARHV